MGKGPGNGHYGICSGWYGYWFSTNYMIGFVGVDRDEWVLVVHVRCVHGCCMCVVHVIGVDR